LASDAFVLLERVTDSVLRILEVREPGKHSGPLAEKRISLAVKLMPLRVSRRRHLLPWRAVVCTHEKEKIRQGLSRLSDWLGIGVDIEEPTTLEPLGRCQNGYDGKDGLVGGTLRSTSDFAVTCKHVISSACKSVIGLPTPIGSQASDPITSAPDAVLLNPRNPCFETPTEVADPVSPSSPAWIEHCLLSRLSVYQTHPGSQGRACGIIKAIVSASAIGSRVYRFPQSEVILDRTGYLFGLITLPFGKKRFSYPGDSGAWIRDSQSGSWIGMVTAGDDRGSTYVSDAGCLVEYFKCITGSNSFLLSATWPSHEGKRNADRD
jgi:hypothetical protein